MKLRIGIDYGKGDASTAVVLREIDTGLNGVVWARVLSKPNDCICENPDILRELFSDEPSHNEGCPAFDRWLVKKCLDRLESKNSSPLWGPLDERYTFSKRSIVFPTLEPTS